MQLTVGVNKIIYDDQVSNPSEDLIIAKLHWNRYLSTPDGNCLIVYFNNFYLNNPMKKAAYYKISIKLIPQEIIKKYDLNNKQSDGYIFVSVKEVMLGLL